MNKKQRLVHICKLVLNPYYWYKGCKHVIVNFPRIVQMTVGFITFFIILIFFMVRTSYLIIALVPIIGVPFRKLSPVFSKSIGKIVDRFIQKLESLRHFQVRRSYLIEIAFENLKARAGRTLVTVFGMAAGVGIIVYLLSLGYGIERLVINQVASLNELRILDVSASENTALSMNQETLDKIRKIGSVENVIPLVSMVGRINFNQAQTDVLVYAASQEFMEISRINISKGDGFSQPDESYNSLVPAGESDGKVAGLTTLLEEGTINEPVDNKAFYINILPEESVAVWSECDVSSDLLGYTTRLEGEIKGKKVWGGTYYPFNSGGRDGYDAENDIYLGRWVATKVPLFSKNLEDELRPVLGNNGQHQWSIGCIQERHIQFNEEEIIVDNSVSEGKVLGDASASAQLVDTTILTPAAGETEKEASASASSDTLASLLAQEGVAATGSAQTAYITEIISTDAAGIEFVRLQASGSGAVKKNTRVKFESTPHAEAIISTGLMKLLRIEEGDIIGTQFDVSFIIAKKLLPGVEGRVLSEETQYKVVGVVEDDDQQFFYIPFSDIRKLGISNFTQLKVVLGGKDGLPDVRAQIETFGYNTASAVDTVSQIESLFSNLRVVLGAIGLIALAVASLGMFNTLTVSLLERTREIGGMKVIGMVSDEIQDLFLAEAMIMGFSGGIGGLFIGYAFGQASSFVISIFSVAQGLGYLQLTYIPPAFTVSILVLSFVVGVFTGLYPAQRAKKISALNALRYE